ncbi:hypothetical protein MRBLMN1_003820 [Chitinophaga ginsengisegetis]|uniref:hypothetical protein n=1 Tax=Chitinophaga ginsengisegetis TaxID=393003 RepID=UPI00343DAA85
MFTSRRDFLKITTLGSAGLLLPPVTAWAGVYKDELTTLSEQLLEQWGESLLALQVNQPQVKGLHGGILCPACATIHGRCGDAIFPLLYLANKRKEQRYADAAIRLYNWMENMVSTPDGAWVNEVSVSDWKGITVFGATSLAEALIHFEHLLDKPTQQQWKNRLQKAGDYLYKNFTINTGNINYPIAGSYALCLIGTYLQQPHFITKGKNLAKECLAWFTANGLIYGEGKPVPEKSAKGCYSVDLGYNVEESLPSLVLYAKLMNDTPLLDKLTHSLKAHLEFMLPDGGWDNSWGTRNFKWTYWGSRTSDGCQPAYALMADTDPAFYKAALQNTRLLAQCTHNKLLHGGPHYVQHGVLPCVSHSLAHSKALATVLLQAPAIKERTGSLPRERIYGVKSFPEINTWLISTYKWRGTITGYDQEYSMKGGHATGGALSMLWHEDIGPLLVASMNRYQMVESFNMQRDNDPQSVCFTPGFNIVSGTQLYQHTNDLKATVDYKENNGQIMFNTHSLLVDENQLPAASPECAISYTFEKEVFHIHATAKNEKAVYSLPVISTHHEPITLLSENKLEIRKAGSIVEISSSAPIKITRALTDRAFNFVPGLEAIPLLFETNNIDIKISVRPRT